jgi:acetolactate synthase regulatory subunit
MSHVSGLFARRGFNVEGILCRPVGDGSRSEVVLVLAHGARLEQVVRQLAKLRDVLQIEASTGRETPPTPTPALTDRRAAGMLPGCKGVIPPHPTRRGRA